MKGRQKFTVVRADIETREALERMAKATERSVPKMLRLVVLRAEREMTEKQEAPHADPIPEAR